MMKQLDFLQPTSRFMIWFRACRLHTIGTSMSPMIVVLGALIADGTFQFFPYLLALLVALTAHITSNLANDYFDFLGGMDSNEDVGFERILKSGLIGLPEIRKAFFISSAACALFGLLLAALQGWWLLAIGVVVIAGAFAYSTGPYPLAHHGLGDVAVVLFFGLIPTLGTYYAVAGTPPTYLIFLGLAIGLWVDNVLVCNNYRDYQEDRLSGKRTIVVMMGEQSGPYIYLFNNIVALACIFTGLMLEGSWLAAIIATLLCSLIFMPGYFAIKRQKGGALIKVLIYTSYMALVVAFILLISLVL